MRLPDLPGAVGGAEQDGELDVEHRGVGPPGGRAHGARGKGPVDAHADVDDVNIFRRSNRARRIRRGEQHRTLSLPARTHSWSRYSHSLTTRCYAVPRREGIDLRFYCPVIRVYGMERDRHFLLTSG